MNYLSVCSGIEAATVAWHNMGWKPIGFSEIEKFPSQLLQHHYPHRKRLSSSKTSCGNKETDRYTFLLSILRNLNHSLAIMQ